MSTATIPRFAAGTWVIDPVRSDVSFAVRHLMVSNVRGRFARFHGTIITSSELLASQVTAEIDVASIDTGNKRRDAHLRSADFLDVENHPTMSFRATGVRLQPRRHPVVGELTLRGLTSPVELQLEATWLDADLWGGTRAGFSATGEIDRRVFGLDASVPLNGSGVVIGTKVQIALEIQAVSTRRSTHPVPRHW